MSLEMTVDYVLRSMERAIMKEVPPASCPVKESKNKWMRDKIKEIISKKILSLKPGPEQTK
jgi:hypothetical protein